MAAKVRVTASQAHTARNAFVRVTHTTLRVASIVSCFALFSPVAQTMAQIDVDEVLRDFGLSDAVKQKVLDGKVIRWTSSEATSRELAVGVLLHSRAEPRALAREFRKVGDFKVVEPVKGKGRITREGGLADFAGLVLQPNGDKEATRYLNAESGDELNLSAKEIAAFRGLNVDGVGAADRTKKVEELVRSTLYRRYQAYRAKGLPGLTPYERGGGDQRRPGEELRRSTKEDEVLAKHAPSFHKFLLEYPAVHPKELEEWFYWVNIEVFERPTLILSHRMRLKVGEVWILADRHFYASHDYNILQQIAGAFPTRDGGTLLIHLNRVSADQAGGFSASVKHPVARGLMGPYIEQMLTDAVARAERKK